MKNVHLLWQVFSETVITKFINAYNKLTKLLKIKFFLHKLYFEILKLRATLIYVNTFIPADANTDSATFNEQQHQRRKVDKIHVHCCFCCIQLNNVAAVALTVYSVVGSEFAPATFSTNSFLSEFEI